MSKEALSMRRAYAKLYRNTLRQGLYPSEYLVRIFMGRYPGLPVLRDNLRGKKVLDLGFGDGRNLKLFRALGMKVFGTEIDQTIVTAVGRSLQQREHNKTLKVGLTHEIPFEDSSFDYLVSWNSSYYMGDSSGYRRYDEHVVEMARVCAENGYVVVSVPMRSHAIFADAKRVNSSGSYVRITSDPNGVRNGIVFRSFKNRLDLRRAFGDYFDEVGYASIRNSFFSVKLDWHICVLRKKRR